MKGKKGDIFDMLSLVIVLAVLAIGLFIMAWIVPQIGEGLGNAGLNNSAEGRNAINQLNDFGVNGIQRGFFWLFIGLCAAQLISSFYVDTHPIWLWLYIIFLGLSIIIAAYMGNLYSQITSEDVFAGFSQGYMALVLSNIVKIALGVGAISMVIIFAKWSYFSGGQRM